MRKTSPLTSPARHDDTSSNPALPPLDETAFFFDVDGTLLEIVAEPGSVVADAALRDLLIRLIARTDAAVALVSGRTLTDLDRIFAPLQLPAAALHGGDIRFPDGSRSAAPPFSQMDQARRPVCEFAAAHPGLMVEDKGATLAVHFRRRPELAAMVMAFLSNLGGGDVAVQEGKLVAELKPVLFDKGAAIAALMQHAPFRGKRPAFYGDDLTDESGFAYVESIGGNAVRVGAAEVPTEAHAHLADPAELRRHLSLLLAEPVETSEAYTS